MTLEGRKICYLSGRVAPPLKKKENIYNACSFGAYIQIIYLILKQQNKFYFLTMIPEGKGDQWQLYDITW